MKFAPLLLATLLLSGCSVYESDGRKTLERGGLTFAKNAQSAYVACSIAPSTGTWIPLEQTDQADVFSSESDSFDLQVAPFTEIPYSCYYRFSSAQDMYENTSQAIDYCLHQSLASCHSEFAFR